MSALSACSSFRLPASPKPLINQHRIYPSLLPGTQPRRSEHKRSSVPMRSRSCMFACLRRSNINCSSFVTLCSLPRDSVPIGPRDCSCLTVKLFLCIRIFRMRRAYFRKKASGGSFDPPLVLFVSVKPAVRQQNPREQRHRSDARGCCRLRYTLRYWLHPAVPPADAGQ